MVQQVRAFKIERGICQFDFSDYYAVLGLPITANATQVRKGYLIIAKNLHPDIYGRSPEEKEKATQYLSKLVNPAYHVLNQERERTEYSAILRLLAKRLMKRSQRISPQSEIAKKLMHSPLTSNYEQAVSAIARNQYSNLDKILDYVSQLSELNLVYILSQEGYKFSTTETSAVPIQAVSQNHRTHTDDTMIQQRPLTPRTSQPSITNEPKATNTGTGNIQQHIRMAEQCINQKQWASALKELRSALQLDSSDSKCHALLGLVYMNQKLAGMAKVSFQQALKLNPKEPVALENIGKVDGSAAKHSSSDAQSKGKDKEQNKKGGFFGWLGQ